MDPIPGRPMLRSDRTIAVQMDVVFIASCPTTQDASVCRTSGAMTGDP